MINLYAELQTSMPTLTPFQHYEHAKFQAHGSVHSYWTILMTKLMLPIKSEGAVPSLNIANIPSSWLRSFVQDDIGDETQIAHQIRGRFKATDGRCGGQVVPFPLPQSSP